MREGTAQSLASKTLNSSYKYRPHCFFASLPWFVQVISILLIVPVHPKLLRGGWVHQFWSRQHERSKSQVIGWSGELEMEARLLSSHSGGPLRLRWIEQPLKRQAWALYVVLKSMLIIIINLIFVFLKGLIIFTIMNGACHPTLLRRVRKPKLGLWFFWSKIFI